MATNAVPEEVSALVRLILRNKEIFATCASARTVDVTIPITYGEAKDMAAIHDLAAGINSGNPITCALVLSNIDLNASA